MLTADTLEAMRRDAELAQTRAYGYPTARLDCARHVLALLEDLEQYRAREAALRGDWSGVRALAADEPAPEAA